jgi:GT2 family glycosyltransferase
MPVAVDIVVPTIGRSGLGALLQSLLVAGAAAGPYAPARIVLADDRPEPDAGLPGLGSLPAALGERILVVGTGGRGPAAARNAGWRAAASPWIAFLDDDVQVTPSWLADLAADLEGLPAHVAGSQGRIRVPLPAGRRPTDWERNVAGLERAQWATADLAYRRGALSAVGGFDERFPRAYREDADLGLRLTGAGFAIVTGSRQVVHPVRPAGRWVSLRLQAGNADDILMWALHGPGWRGRAGVPHGRRNHHLLTTAAGVAGLAGLATRRPAMTAAGLAGWLLGTAELAAARIAPGPASRREVATMALTSLAMPPVATAYWLAGLARLARLRHPHQRAVAEPAPPRLAAASRTAGRRP